MNILGISLAVGRLTLDQLGQVRILDPQLLWLPRSLGSLVAHVWLLTCPDVIRPLVRIRYLDRR